MNVMGWLGRLHTQNVTHLYVTHLGRTVEGNGHTFEHGDSLPLHQVLQHHLTCRQVIVLPEQTAQQLRPVQANQADNTTQNRHHGCSLQPIDLLFTAVRIDNTKMYKSLSST